MIHIIINFGLFEVFEARPLFELLRYLKQRTNETNK